MRSSWGGLFYHPIFVEGGRRILGFRGSSSSINYNSQVIGAINLLFRTRALAPVALTPPLFQYFGPLFFEPMPCKNVWEGLVEWLSTIVDFAYFSLPPGIDLPQGITQQWRKRQFHTIALDAEGLQKWGAGFRDDVRNKIRKAIREHLQVERIESLPLGLWKNAYTRKGVSPPIEPLLLSQWSQQLLNASLLRMYAVCLDGIAVAFRGELFFGDYAYDWIAGSDPARHALGVNQLLMAEIGNDLKSHNLKAWDLVGAEVKSIADFKRSFGAKEIAYYHIYRSFSVKGKAFEFLRHLKHGR